MPFNDERHNFRDPGFPGYLHVQELTPAERKAALEAQEAGEQKAAEDYKKSVAARREMEEKAESMWDDVVREKSVIKTPAQLRAESLGWVPQPDGSLIHVSELQRRAAQQEREEEGFATPAQTAAFLRENGLDDEYEEDEPEENDGWSSVAIS